MMCCVNMATPIHLIDGKCHIKLKAGKSHETCLTNCTWPISHNIMPLVINVLGGRHTDIHTPNQSNFKKPGMRGLCLRMPGLKILKKLVIKWILTNFNSLVLKFSSLFRLVNLFRLVKYQ